MFDSLIDAIKRSVSVEEFAEGSTTAFYSREVFLPPKPYLAQPLRLSSLSSLTEIACSIEERGSEPPLAFHVVSPTQVDLVGLRLGQCRTRETYAIAHCDNDFAVPGLPSMRLLNQAIEIQYLLIGLRVHFVEDENLKALIAKLGNVTKGKTVTLEDDGFSQAVSSKTSISSGSKQEMPVEIELKPKRTFGEIPVDKMCPSKFVLRFFDKGVDAIPHAALYESDYSAWEATASRAIGSHVVELLTALYGDGNSYPPVWY